MLFAPFSNNHHYIQDEYQKLHLVFIYTNKRKSLPLKLSRDSKRDRRPSRPTLSPRRLTCRPKPQRRILTPRLHCSTARVFPSHLCLPSWPPHEPPTPPARRTRIRTPSSDRSRLAGPPPRRSRRWGRGWPTGATQRRLAAGPNARARPTRRTPTR